ncbi:MAG: DNA polymerase III subunit delta' C-terminal domain-containing protein [Actinomycetota bacterium]|nr:DNA polymerase III subunit delta' C-terminal domain-containing protein [Actinomycetota bacterium]
MKILQNPDFLIDDDINQSNIKSLSGMVESGKLAHAYLFYGNNMEPLFKIALEFAASINCEDNGCGECLICKNTLKGVYPNVLIVEPEGNIMRIEEIIEVQKFMGLTSYNPGKKICIIKESELMNQEAANRLLKTLEDPPDDNSIFVLLTEDISAVLPTVASRCLTYGWNLRFEENKPDKDDFRIIDEYLNEGIKNILINTVKEESEEDSTIISLNLTLKILGVLKKMESAFKTDMEKELSQIRSSDFDKSYINKYVNILKSKYKRRAAKFHNLAMSRIFDIISAWLEDIIAVVYGAQQESLNYKENFSFIRKNIKNVKIEKIFKLMKLIEENRIYLNYSINSELTLDNIFLQFQDIYK